MTAALRSFLFVPGDSDRKLAKAPASGADALLLDLEDSVATPNKPRARAMVAEYLQAPHPGPQRWVRINPLDEGGLPDLATIVRPGLAGIMLPKIAGPADILRLAHCLDALEAREDLPPGAIRILPVATETAAAPFGLHLFATTPAHPRLHGLTWGAEDLSTALGATTNQDENGTGWATTYQLVRSLTLLAARAAGVEPVETLHANFRDEPGLRRSSEAAAREGFTARMAIHPDQVSVINQAFTPSEAQLAHAHQVVAAFAADPTRGTASLNGAMLDKPHLTQARRLLARAATPHFTP